MSDGAKQIFYGVASMVIGTVLLSIWPAGRAWLLGQVYLPGWLLLCMCALGIVLGYLVGRRGRRVTVPTVPLQPARSFTPSEFQDAVIRVLRFADDKFRSADEIASGLKDAPVSDVKQALQQLTDEGWAKDILGMGSWRFALAGAGLDYARDRGYPVISAEEKRKLRWD